MDRKTRDCGPDTGANRGRARLGSGSGLSPRRNPSRWKGLLENLLPNKSKVRRVEHRAALPYSELPAFMAELRLLEGVAPRALEFLILNASRTGEAIGARWSEIDMHRRLWTVPASRIKSGREHRVPLSEPAMAILETLSETRESAFVFPGQRGGRPLSSNTLLLVLRRLGRGNVTVHGFRSSFRTWAAEQTDFPREIAEAALAHVVGDRVEFAYQRSDFFQKRRLLAEAWAQFCLTPAPAGDVLPLRRRVG